MTLTRKPIHVLLAREQNAHDLYIAGHPRRGPNLPESGAAGAGSIEFEAGRQFLDPDEHPPFARTDARDRVVRATNAVPTNARTNRVIARAPMRG